MIQYYLGSWADVSIEISELATGKVVRELDGTGRSGLNRVAWNLRTNPALQGPGGGGLPVSPGTYRVMLTVGDATHSALLEVLEDRWLEAPETAAADREIGCPPAAFRPPVSRRHRVEELPGSCPFAATLDHELNLLGRRHVGEEVPAAGTSG